MMFSKKKAATVLASLFGKGQICVFPSTRYKWSYQVDGEPFKEAGDRKRVEGGSLLERCLFLLTGFTLLYILLNVSMHVRPVVGFSHNVNRTVLPIVTHVIMSLLDDSPPFSDGWDSSRRRIGLADLSEQLPTD